MLKKASDQSNQEEKTYRVSDFWYFRLIKGLLVLRAAWKQRLTPRFNESIVEQNKKTIFSQFCLMFI